MDVSAVAVDANDNVYVLCRGTHPVLVFDSSGNLVRHWGDGEFDNRAHGIHASPDGFIWTVNDNHTVSRNTHQLASWS